MKKSKSNRPEYGAILKEGQLWKEGETKITSNSAWKKRTFKLTDTNQLLYYHDDELKGKIALDDNMTTISVDPAKCLQKKRENIFMIIKPNRTYFLSADTPAIADDWIQAIVALKCNVKTDSSVLLRKPPAPPEGSKPTLVLIKSKVKSKAKQHTNTTPSGSQATTPATTTTTITSTSSSSSNAPVVDPLDPAQVCFEGFMLKQGEVNQSDKRRYFVLTRANQTLYYFEKKATGAPLLKGSIPLKTAEVFKSEKNSHVFCIKIPERTYFLTCSSETEVNKWLDAIRSMRRPVQPLKGKDGRRMPTKKTSVSTMLEGAEKIAREESLLHV